MSRGRVNAAALTPGTVVAGWHVRERLGVGGYGAAYLVEDASRPGPPCVLKLALCPGDARAEREAVLLLDKAVHPNVVRCHGCGHWPDPVRGHPFLVLEYVPGPALHLWAEHSNPDFLRLAQVGGEVALALSALHTRGVLHRDLKPEHIIVRETDGRPVLLDFGVSHHEGALPLTESPLPPGTAHLRSPEAACFWLAHAEHSGASYRHGPADDLYALGVCLYRALTGHYPFPATDLKRLQYLDIAYRAPAAPALVNPRVPRGLSDLVMRLLAKHPEQRYRDGEEIHAALMAALVFGDDAPWEARVFEWEVSGEADAGEPPSPRSIRRPDAPPRLPTPAGEPPPEPEQAPPVHVAGEPRTGGRGRRSRRMKVVLGLMGAGALVATGLLLAPTRGVPPSADPTAPVTPADPPAPVRKVAHDARESDTAPAAPPPSRADATPAATAQPVHDEDSPSMKKNTQKKNTRRGHPPQETPAASPPHIPGSWKAAGAAACLQAAACVGAPVRPLPEDCPPRALAAMKQLRAWNSNNVIVDINQPLLAGPDGPETTRAVFRDDGPIISSLVDAIGGMPEGTLFYGYLYVSGDWGENRFGGKKVYGRYHKVKLPNGREYPVCFILGNADGMPRLEGSRPGAVWLWRSLPIRPVERYVFE